MISWSAPCSTTTSTFHTHEIAPKIWFWVEGVKGISGDFAEDIEYVETQWRRKFMDLNSNYIESGRSALEKYTKRLEDEMAK